LNVRGSISKFDENNLNTSDLLISFQPFLSFPTKMSIEEPRIVYFTEKGIDLRLISPEYYQIEKGIRQNTSWYEMMLRADTKVTPYKIVYTTEAELARQRAEAGAKARQLYIDTHCDAIMERIRNMIVTTSDDMMICISDYIVGIPRDLQNEIVGRVCNDVYVTDMLEKVAVAAAEPVVVMPAEEPVVVMPAEEPVVVPAEEPVVVPTEPVVVLAAPTAPARLPPLLPTPCAAPMPTTPRPKTRTSRHRTFIGGLSNVSGKGHGYAIEIKPFVIDAIDFAAPETPVKGQRSQPNAWKSRTEVEAILNQTVKWYYVDNKQLVQGPFDEPTMQVWQAEGHLPNTLQISTSASGPFTSLNKVFRQPSRAFKQQTILC
jgi:hypothetical protein